MLYPSFRNLCLSVCPSVHPSALCFHSLSVVFFDRFSSNLVYELSRVTRKPTICICENKDADQLRGNPEADQRLCFRYIDRMIPLLSKSEISSLWPSCVAVQPGLCRTRSETRTLVFSRCGSIDIGKECHWIADG